MEGMHVSMENIRESCQTYMEDGGSACTEIKCMWFGDRNAVEGQDSAEVKHKHRCLAMVLLQFLAHQKNHMGLVAQCSK